MDEAVNLPEPRLQKRMECAMPVSQTRVPPLPPQLAGNGAVPQGRMPPATSAGASSRLWFRVRTGYVVLALVLCLPLLCAIGIAGCFRLSSATEALQSSVIESVPGQWDKRFWSCRMVRSPASRQVLAKASMKREGLMRQHVRQNEVFEDVVVIGLVRKDWKNPSQD